MIKCQRCDKEATQLIRILGKFKIVLCNDHKVTIEKGEYTIEDINR